MDSNINLEYQEGLNRKLIDAAGEGNIPDMMEWLNAGAQINGFARCITALMSAASKGQLAAVEFLCMNGANLNILTEQNKNTALIYAAIDGHIDVVNYLIYVGAKLDCQNVYGNTAFMLAYRCEDKSAAFNLLCAMPMQHIIDMQATNRFDLVVQPCKDFIIQNQEKMLEILNIFEEPDSSVKGLFLTLPIEIMAKIFHESGLFDGYPYGFRLIEDIGYILNHKKTMTFQPLEDKDQKRKATEILESEQPKIQKTFLPSQSQGKKRKAEQDDDLQNENRKYQKTEKGEKDTTDLTQKSKPGK